MSYSSIDSELYGTQPSGIKNKGTFANIGNHPNGPAGSIPYHRPYTPMGCHIKIPAVIQNPPENVVKSAESASWFPFNTTEKCSKPYSLLSYTNLFFKGPKTLSPTCSHLRPKKKLSTQTPSCLKKWRRTCPPVPTCAQTTECEQESCVEKPKKIFLVIPSCRTKEKGCVNRSGFNGCSKKKKNNKPKKQPCDDGLNFSWCPRGKGIICVCPDPCEGTMVEHGAACRRSCVRIKEAFCDQEALSDRCFLTYAAVKDKPVDTEIPEIQRAPYVTPRYEDKRHLKERQLGGCTCVTKTFYNTDVTVSDQCSQKDFNIQTDLIIENKYEKPERNSKETQAAEADKPYMGLSRDMENYIKVLQIKNEAVDCHSCHCTKLEAENLPMSDSDEKSVKECQSPDDMISVYTIPECCENVIDMENHQTESLDLLRPPVKRGFGNNNVNLDSRSNGYASHRDYRKNISVETQYPLDRVIRGAESSTSLILKTTAEKCLQQYSILSYTSLLFDRKRKISPTCSSSKAKKGVQPCPPRPICSPPKPSCQKVVTCNKSTQTNNPECCLKKRKPSCKRVQATVSNQESCYVPSKEVFLVVPACNKEKVYQLKTTGSACTFPQSYNCMKDEVIPIEQLSTLKLVLDSLNMDKIEKNKKRKKNENCFFLCKDKARTKDVICACPDVFEPEVQCRKSFVRITGRLGLSQDDRYVLRCDATVNDKPVATEFAEIRRASTEAPRHDDSRYIKKGEVDACTCLTKNFNNTVSNNLSQKRDFNIQTDLESHNKYEKPEKNTRSMLSKETQAAEVDFSIGLSTDMEKYKKAYQFKNEIVQYYCSNIEAKNPPERDHDENAVIECQNPLVVISVYPIPDCCENVAVVENQPTATVNYPPRKPLYNQKVKHHPNNQNIREKKNDSKDVKTASRSRSPTPNRNQNKNKNIPENKVLRTRKISPERDTPIAMHSRQDQKTKDTNIYRLSFKDRIRDRSPPRTPTNRKNTKGTNTDHNITKKKIVDHYTDKLAAYLNNQRIDTPFRYPEMDSSKITVNIDGDKERYDLRFQKENKTTEMKVKKTVKETHNRKPGDFLGVFPPMNNCITPDEPRKNAQTVYRSEQVNDAPTKTFARLQARDSLEISHRHDVNAVKPVKKITNDSDESSEHFSAPIKHYRGDNCPIADPIKRDKEIRTLLGIDKGVASLVKDVKVEKKKYTGPVHYYYNRTCEKKIVTGINLMEVVQPCVCCDIRKNFRSNSSCSCSRRRNVQPHKEPSQPEVPQYGGAQPYGDPQLYGEAQPYAETRSSEKQPHGRAQSYNGAQLNGRTQSNLGEQPYIGAQPYETTQPCGGAQSYETTQPYGGAQPYETTQPYGGAQQSEPQSNEEPEPQGMNNTIIRKLSPALRNPYPAVQGNPQEESSEESPNPEENINSPGKSTGTQYEKKVHRTSLYQQLILNRNIQVFLQVEQFSKQKPIILSRKQYDKVKRTIESTLTNKSGRDNKRKNCICKTSLVSVGDVRRRSRIVPTSYFHRESQTDKKEREGIFKKSSSISNKSVRINDERVNASPRIPSKRTLVLYSKETTVDPLQTVNAVAPVAVRQAVSSIELRYSTTSGMKQVTFSSTNVEVGSTTAALQQQELLSIRTIFKGRRISSGRRKCLSPNLGTSIYSLCSDELKPRTPPPGAPEPKKKPFLRRLMSCLVMRSARASELNNNVLNPPVKIPSVQNSSIDSYHISTSLGEIEVTSSIYDTSASFYTNHSIYPINSNKMKRGGFFNSVREFLSNRKS